MVSWAGGRCLVGAEISIVVKSHLCCEVSSSCLRCPISGKSFSTGSAPGANSPRHEFAYQSKNPDSQRPNRSLCRMLSDEGFAVFSGSGLKPHVCEKRKKQGSCFPALMHRNTRRLKTMSLG